MVNTIYVVLCTPPLGAETLKYAAGRDLLLYGKKVLTIDHRDSVVNAGQSKDARAIVREAAIALTSSR